MPYTIVESETYPQAADVVYTAILGAVGGLEGEIAKQDPENRSVFAKFSKTIHGKVLGDRTHATLSVASNSPSESEVTIEIYPVDAVGRKLQFGARKGVARTVLTWLFAHIEHRLKP